MSRWCATQFGGDVPIHWEQLEPKAQTSELQQLVGELQRGEKTILELGGWLDQMMPKVGITECASRDGMRHPSRPAR